MQREILADAVAAALLERRGLLVRLGRSGPGRSGPGLERGGKRARARVRRRERGSRGHGSSNLAGGLAAVEVPTRGAQLLASAEQHGSEVSAPRLALRAHDHGAGRARQSSEGSAMRTLPCAELGVLVIHLDLPA